MKILKYFIYFFFFGGVSAVYANKILDTTITLSSGQQVDMIYDEKNQIGLPSGVSLQLIENQEYLVFQFPLLYGEYTKKYDTLSNHKGGEYILKGIIQGDRSSFDAFIMFSEDSTYYDVYCKSFSGIEYGHSRIYRNGQIWMRINSNIKRVIQKKQYRLLAQNWNIVRLIDIYLDYLNRIYNLVER